MHAPRFPSRLALLALALGIIGTGCYLGRGVPIQGEVDELAALEGVWEGTYAAEDGGRSGRLSFRLAAGADSAYGEVVMLVEAAGQPPPAPPAEGGRPPALVPLVERPTIRFVRVDEGVVAGTLDPYTDPACRCLIQTAFQGTLAGDEIRGTFVSWRVSGGTVGGGTWRAERVSAGGAL